MSLCHAIWALGARQGRLKHERLMLACHVYAYLMAGTTRAIHSANMRHLSTLRQWLSDILQLHAMPLQTYKRHAVSLLMLPYGQTYYPQYVVCAQRALGHACLVSAASIMLPHRYSRRVRAQCDDDGSETREQVVSRPESRN